MQVQSVEPSCLLLLQTTTANLERVRKMKTRHQRLQTRVTTVREELQSFLEDDDDMMKMCLTHKKEHEQQQVELQRAGGQPTLILYAFA